MDGKRQLHSLTALKGLFMLIIVFHNSSLIIPGILSDYIPGSSFIASFGGTLGDTMFFMLSGFLISYGYRERVQMHQISFGDFFCKRLKKLYPLYIITNAAALILDVVQYGMSAINLKRIAFTMLLQTGGGLSDNVPYNSPTWFISALFVCYIVFFFIAFHAQKPTQYYFAVVFGIIWGYILIQVDSSVPFCFQGNGVSFTNFFIGCGLAELYPLIRQKTHKWLRPTCFFVLAASGFLLMRYGVHIISGDFATACSFLLFPMLIYLAVAEGLFSKLLQMKPFVGLGKLSVSIYFWHLVIFKLFLFLYSLLVPGGKIQGMHYILYLILLAALSAVSYKLIEVKTARKSSIVR